MRAALGLYRVARDWPRLRRVGPARRDAGPHGGTNFAIWAQGATAVDLCLFDEVGREERIPLTERVFNVFHRHLDDLPAGTRYGFRVTARGTRPRPPLEPEQAAARPLRQGHRGRASGSTRPSTATSAPTT